jgi:hypothetical protein
MCDLEEIQDSQFPLLTLVWYGAGVDEGHSRFGL